VVTLVYGLGFGMLLVLLIVPALLAVGHDMSRAARSLRRALGLNGQPVGGGLRLLPRLAVALVAAAFAATLGWYLVTGEAGPVTALLLPGAATAAAALTAFIGVVAAGLALLWLTGAALLLRARRTGATDARLQPR
jgi:hypothetical protein